MSAGPKRTLRFEGGLIGAIALYLYAQSGAGWWLFAALILVPDISMIGYLKNTQTGALTYNLAHNYIAPVLLWLVLWAFAFEAADALALIWIAHIGIDRLLGFGLKYPDDFKHTHLN